MHQLHVVAPPKMRVLSEGFGVDYGTRATLSGGQRLRPCECGTEGDPLEVSERSSWLVAGALARPQPGSRSILP